MTIQYQIIHWRDIPAQVNAKAGRQRKGQVLSQRFSVAIDQAAMLAGLTESEAYLAEWHKTDWQEKEGELLETVEALAAELEADYPPARLRTLVQQHGLEKNPD